MALAVVVMVAALALAVGAISGRVTARSCCAPGDPAHDRRMADPSSSLGSGTDPARPPGR